MKAAEKGHRDVADALINLNAELNLQNSVRSTFLCNHSKSNFRLINQHDSLPICL